MGLQPDTLNSPEMKTAGIILLLATTCLAAPSSDYSDYADYYSENSNHPDYYSENSNYPDYYSENSNYPDYYSKLELPRLLLRKLKLPRLLLRKLELPRLLLRKRADHDWRLLRLEKWNYETEFSGGLPSRDQHLLHSPLTTRGDRWTQPDW